MRVAHGPATTDGPLPLADPNHAERNRKRPELNARNPPKATRRRRARGTAVRSRYCSVMTGSPFAFLPVAVRTHVPPLGTPLL